MTSAGKDVCANVRASWFKGVKGRNAKSLFSVLEGQVAVPDCLQSHTNMSNCVFASFDEILL